MTLLVGIDRVRTTSELDITLRSICARCNSGWLHELERDFRSRMMPALHGLPVRLDRNGQTIAATWATKTWLFAESAFGYLRGGGARSPGALRWIREHGEPPPNYEVHLGHVDAEFRQVFWASTIPVWAVPDQRPVGIMGVFAVGHLLLHLWAPLNDPERPETGTGIGIGPRLGPYLTQIWPLEREDVQWPPPGILSRDDIDRLWPPRGRFLIPPSD
jgi:hypothetical protein